MLEPERSLHRLRRWHNALLPTSAHLGARPAVVRLSSLSSLSSTVAVAIARAHVGALVGDHRLAYDQHQPQPWPIAFGHFDDLLTDRQKRAASLQTTLTALRADREREIW